MKADSLVLVTRAGTAGSNLAERLRREGWQALHRPPIELAAVADQQACAARLEAMLPADRVILTSSEGVRQAVALVGVKALSGSQLIVPGPGTAAVARNLGLDRVVSPQQGGDSEAMLALPELATVSGLRVLVLAAAGGRRLLEAELRKRGARVERLHVYRRLPRCLPDSLADDMASAGRVITLVSSGGALDALKSGVSRSTWQDLLAGSMLVPSPRVAEMARKAGARVVIDAKGADDDSFCQALVALQLR